ncbi:DinB family protein [Aureivirga marina]|uniref:DinB family protein n=1 Tax=Aureivirga marina TaxID=1182451 RepID=UPI0018CA9590|nr:DinB family protein [Aureivirga marina]
MKKIITSFTFVLFIISGNLSAQIKIENTKGYSPQIGALVSMLEDLKGRIERNIQNLDQEETDYLLDENANRIGAMIIHLAATEAYYQNFTFENRNFNRKEKKKWMTALTLGEEAREKYKGKPIQYYMKIWDEVRAKTLENLKTKDDAWLLETDSKNSMNYYWAWFHVMEHQANHMGQIALIKKRISKE